MKYLTTILFLLTFVSSYSKEDNQLLASGDKYAISVTHGGNPLGTIELELYPEVAPKHCRNFDSLVSIKFYDGCAFHRVIPNFMIQGGDPNSKDKPKSTWGYGDPSQTTVPAEFSNLKHVRGILSAARKGGDINSATSQFFICVTTASHLDGQYTIYGNVTQGMDIVDKIVNVPRDMSTNNPNDKVEMKITKIVNAVKDKAPNLSEETIRISPNPASDFIEITYPQNDLSFPIIFNIFGEEVNLTPTLSIRGEGVWKVLPSGEDLGGVMRMDISSLQTGVYFVRIGNHIGKFIKI